MKAHQPWSFTMKSTALVYAAALAALSLGSQSFAQDFGARGRHAEPPRFEQRGPAYQNGRDFRHPQFDRRDVRQDRRFDTRGPRFHRGDRLPAHYRNQARVNDWQARRLHAPARGQQWVQVDGNYALIAIATGVIASLVLAR
jgi:Ni/Co efflux regulator RcnB